MHAIGLLMALLLAGCASEPTSPAPPTATATSTPPMTTPTPPDPAPIVGVRLHLVGPPDPVRSGEPVVFRIILENRNGSTLWTEPTFSCNGTWDVQLFDASGARVRIDDRDAMGCPSGGPLTREVSAGSDAVAEYSWDGQTRPALGQEEPMPPGRYDVRASAAHGDASDDATLESRTANVTLVVT